MVLEDEFAGRDARGLKPDSDSINSEQAERMKYVKMLFVGIPIIGQVFAWTTYLVCGQVFGQQKLYDKKFEFVKEYQLGYVFLALWILSVARIAVVINANAARAPARVDRPDQQVYKVMAASGPLADAPFVMMANTGPQGRFNRAQRALYNMDENLPVVLANTIAVASIFGPVVIGLVLLIAVGRIFFAVKYTESLNARGKGFMLCMLGEKWIEGLLLLCAILGLC